MARDRVRRNVRRPRLLVRHQAPEGTPREGDPPPRVRVRRRPPAVPHVQQPEHEGLVRRGGPYWGRRETDASRVQARGTRVRPAGPDGGRGGREEAPGGEGRGRMGGRDPHRRVLPDPVAPDLRGPPARADPRLYGGAAGEAGDRGRRGEADRAHPEVPRRARRELLVRPHTAALFSPPATPTFISPL